MGATSGWGHVDAGDMVARADRLDREAIGATLSGPMTRSWAAGALALLIGLVALVVPPRPFDDRPTWETLLAPYGSGAPLPQGFRVEGVHRGSDNGVVISVRRPDGGAAVEVLVVERGRWQSVHESRSFTIDYELPRSPAAERDAVTAFFAETIRSRDHGLPAPDAVALHADDPTVLPWWFESVRGARGMLIGASLVVLAVLLLVRSSALAVAGLVLGAIDLAARFVGIPVLRWDVGLVWIVPACAAAIVAALWGRRFRPVTPLWPASIVAAVALLARLALGPWGPLHVNGHGPRFVAAVTSNPGDIAAYGPGYHEIFAPIAALAPASPDWAIFAANALFSALLPPLAFVIGRMVGLGTSAAVTAAGLLAIDPVAIRMGATEAYFPAIAFLGTAGAAAMLAALFAMEAGGRWRAAALLVAAGLLVSQAARIHPCAWVLMATVPFVVVAGDTESWRRRVLMILAAAAVSGGVLLFTSATAVLDVFGNIRAGTVFRPPTPSPWPLVWIALPGLAYAVLAPWRWLAVPAGIAVAAMLLTRQAFDASWIWQQSYFRLYLTLPVLAAVAAIPAAYLSRGSVVGAATLLLGLAWMGFGWPVVADRTPEHREYRLVRDHLERMPPECGVAYLPSAGRRVVRLPTYVGPPRAVIDARHSDAMAAAVGPGKCLHYVHTSLCSTAEGRSECEAIERRLGLVPIAHAAFGAPRQHETFGYDGDVIETWIARVDRARAD